MTLLTTIMRSWIGWALIAAMLSSSTFAQSSNPPAVIVTKTSLQIPAGAAANTFIWRQFSKAEREANLPNLKVADWESARSRNVSDLLAKAKAAGLEAERLRIILDRIHAERGSLAIVPTEAHRAMQGSRPVWIVACRWEITSAPPLPQTRLGHQRIYAYDLTTLERVAFETCR